MWHSQEVRRAVRLSASALVAATVLLPIVAIAPVASAATPSFVQVKAKQITSGTVNALQFSNPAGPGNLIVAYVVWSNAGTVTLSDNRGDAFTPVAAATRWNANAWSSQVFFAKNIVGGTTKVTATFGSAINSFGILYIHEYAGLDTVNPLDVTRSAIGTSKAISSGSVTTAGPNELIFGAGASSGKVTKAGTGFTSRSTAQGNITEDLKATTAGNYSATATENSGAWVMHVVAFRAAAPAGDTTPPTASITSPAQNAQVSGTVNVTADASDDVGVAGVRFYVDGVAIGAEDTSAPYGVPWDTRTVGNGTHTLTAVARDAAGNTGQSEPVTVTVNNQIPDTTPPTATITSPAQNAQVSDIVNVTADASDDVGVAGVRFEVDGTPTGTEDTTAPYGLPWDTRTVANGAHTLTAVARDAAGNTGESLPVTVNVANTNQFQNEILATGFTLPTNIEFLPDGRMLVVELGGTIKILPPPYTQPDPTPFLQLPNVGNGGVQQGMFDIALDPDFVNNHYYYVFYTLGTPNRDRLSRFTANATNTGTLPGSEFVLYQDPRDANAEHHGGAIAFGNDGKLYFTTGEHFEPGDAQFLTNPRGKIHRINRDGTIPTDNPFYDGAGPNVDSIWALGLRNPFRAYYDVPTGRFFVGDVGGNDYSTAKEEIDLGARGANYGWPDYEGDCPPPCTSPLYFYPHNGRDAAVVAGFVYHGTQFPSSYQGSFFYGDYTQHVIKRLTFDQNGNVNGVFNFEPPDGTPNGPYGDIVYLTEGPDGALYYVDLGYSDIGGQFGVSKIRRIRYLSTDQAPVAVAAADTLSGPVPLTVTFSSAGSFDPEGKPLTYLWSFGDGTSSTAANPVHTYAAAGTFTVRLSVSDGANTTFAVPLSISGGNRPTGTILSPQDGILFKADDVITFSGDGTDTEDGSLPASAFTWNIDFLHEGHVHPGVPITGVKNGSFVIPSNGHDFSGFTRYRISLTVKDSDGLTSTTSVTIFPQKVNLTFDTTPAGRTLYLDGIAKTAPFVYDTLVGFHHTIDARDQADGSTQYTFSSWSDGGRQVHTIVVPSSAQTYVATFTSSPITVPLEFVQVNSATPQSPQTTVNVSYTAAQIAGDANIVAIGWNSTTSTITAVTDSKGNAYQVAAPLARGSGLSQAIYYAKNVAAATAGANIVTVTFSAAVPYADVRVTEYRGVDPINAVDVTGSASGSSSLANSGSVTTAAARELIFGAGMTSGNFTSAGSGFTTRVITDPDADIAEDRFVTATGAYSATAPLGGAAGWLMQVVTFRGIGQ